jgi:hypothetical protein
VFRGADFTSIGRKLLLGYDYIDHEPEQERNVFVCVIKGGEQRQSQGVFISDRKAPQHGVKSGMVFYSDSFLFDVRRRIPTHCGRWDGDAFYFFFSYVP